MTQGQHHRPTTFEIEHLVQTQVPYLKAGRLKYLYSIKFEAGTVA
jgi:hypothetical protein